MHDPEDGTLSSCSSITQRAMKLGLGLDESRKTADSSDVNLWGIGFGAKELRKLTKCANKL